MPLDLTILTFTTRPVHRPRVLAITGITAMAAFIAGWLYLAIAGFLLGHHDQILSIWIVVVAVFLVGLVSSIFGHRCPDCRRRLAFPNINVAPADFPRIAAHAATHGVTMTIPPLPPMIAGDDGAVLNIQGFHCRHCRSFHVTNVFWFPG